jgi:hypothetical protein
MSDTPMRKPKPLPPVAPARPALPHAPYPAKNLGAHLKRPESGEIVTLHHRGAKKR